MKVAMVAMVAMHARTCFEKVVSRARLAPPSILTWLD